MTSQESLFLLICGCKAPPTPASAPPLLSPEGCWSLFFLFRSCLSILYIPLKSPYILPFSMNLVHVLRDSLDNSLDRADTVLNQFRIFDSAPSVWANSGPSAIMDILLPVSVTQRLDQNLVRDLPKIYTLINSLPSRADVRGALGFLRNVLEEEDAKIWHAFLSPRVVTVNRGSLPHRSRASGRRNLSSPVLGC